MSDAAWKMLYTRMDEVSHLVEHYPLYLPVIVAAEALHMKPEALRASIEQGRCPFGFCWKLGNRMAYKVPTLAFVAWITHGTAISAQFYC